WRALLVYPPAVRAIQDRSLLLPGWHRLKQSAGWRKGASGVKRLARGGLTRVGFNAALASKIDRAGPSHDDTVPLPDEAVAYLRPDNQRLLELRRRYQRLGSPLCDRTLWDDDNLSGELVLRYFRGDNAYLWQLR